MDAAASEWKGSAKGQYKQPKSGKEFTSAELVAHWKSLVDKYPIVSSEDGLDEGGLGRLEEDDRRARRQTSDCRR